MDKTIINGSIFDNATIKQSSIIADINYHDLNKKIPMIDKRKKSTDKQKLSLVFSPGIFTTVDIEHQKGYPPAATNFPPYPSESCAPSVTPSGTWRSVF